MVEPAALREDAAAIRQAALEAVLPERLCTAAGSGLALAGPADRLRHAGADVDPVIDLTAHDRIVIVGGGKAAAGLAAGVEVLLGPERLARHRVTGLVSVPVGCGRRLAKVEVRETRPPGANLPTPGVVRATHDMLALVGSLGPRDLAIVLVTGGGSALLAAPAPGVTLAEKIAVTRLLSTAGAGIAEINAVRRAASTVKAGGLARACTAGRLAALVISDVIGDALDVIASGPCAAAPASAAAALEVLTRYGVPAAGTASGLVAFLERAAGAAADEPRAGGAVDPEAATWTTPQGCLVSQLVLGSNATAVTAAAAACRRLGYATEVRQARAAGESAEDTGRRLAAEALTLAVAVRGDGGPRAVVEGGEATVTVPVGHGRGGRNQQTVLAAVTAVASAWPAGLLLASIGTDGEDGPTDAAGASADAGIVAAIGRQRLDVAAALERCDAYPLLAAAGGLVRTGTTGTNVADVRLILARP
jgi:glycerate-2-kinase